MNIFQVELDGVALELPSIEGVVILNISSWGGGCLPWQIRCGGSAGVKKIPDARLEGPYLFYYLGICR